METHVEQNLKMATISLTASIHDINCIQNDSVDQLKELDNVKQTIAIAIMLIRKCLEK